MQNPLSNRQHPAAWARFGLLALGCLLLLWRLAPQPLTAQSAATSYWRYPASQPLTQLQPVDINNDGVQELLVTGETGETALLSAKGEPLWQHSAGHLVTAVGTADIDGDGNQEVVLALRNRLILLSSAGAELWQQPLVPIDPPLALLASDGTAAYQTWLAQFDAQPRAITAFDTNQDGQDEIAVLLASGQLQLFDGQGALKWRYTRNTTPGLDATPQIAVDDLNRDGRPEIVLGFFRRFTQLTILDGNGRSLWDQPLGISGRITALQLVDFPEHPGISLAVATDRGDLNLYNVARQRIWPRTLNVPITALTTTVVRDEPMLIAGTAVGTVIAFNGNGRRIWTRSLDEDAQRPILALSGSSFTTDERRPVVSATLSAVRGTTEPSDVLLLSNNGGTLSRINAVDTSGLSRMTDINGDHNSELLLARFANVELIGIGIGASETASEWQYSLDAAPRAMLVTDLNLDGEDELVVGAQNGNVHCIRNDRRLCWLLAPGGAITHLAQISTIATFPPNIVLVRNQTEIDEEGITTFSSWLEMWEANGDQVWEMVLPSEITALEIANLNDRGQPEIIVGTRDGQIIVFTSSQTELWSYTLPQESAAFVNQDPRIQQLFTMMNNYTGQIELVAVTPNAIYKVNDNLFSRLIAHFDSQIEQVYTTSQPGGELASRILVVLADGTLRGLHWDGIQLPQWPLALDGTPLASHPANDIITEAFQENTAESFIIATTANEVVRVALRDNEPTIVWRQPGLEDAAKLYWGDLDGDSLADMAVGTANNQLHLFANATESPQSVEVINLSGSIFSLLEMDRANNQSDLVAITTNGEVELFRVQENRPPLLTSPEVTPAPGRYTFSIDVTDVEGDEIQVVLEIADEAGNWQAQETRSTEGGRIVWTAVDPPPDLPVNYRFAFTDGIYTGTISPPPLPPPQTVVALPGATPLSIGLLAAIGLATAVVLVRQWQMPSARARRFYRRIQQQRHHTLPLLEERYIHLAGSQDFLLYLASQARQNGDDRITNLADGLYLLPERPLAGLPIILGTIQETAAANPPWDDAERWYIIFKTSLVLLEAPSITELSLQRPQLVQLLTMLEQEKEWSPALDSLLPIITNIRDSQRVEQAEDSLVYLNEAAYLLNELEHNLNEFSDRIEKTLSGVIGRRWSGLVTAEIQEVRGRAELTLTLKTRRLVPSETIEVVLEVHNSGRAAAETVMIQLADDPAYQVMHSPRVLTILPPGRSKEIAFAIRPLVSDSFRLAVTATFDDRIQRDRRLVFADMVHLLPPTREFSPINNPYMPGTPLRPNSSLFFGRNQLFNFIASNIGSWSGRNVLILIGQRRTGKTSALLRLEERLPPHLLPVYIDCQSLGVVAGMPALFYDMAWLIADALAERDIELEVPNLSDWEGEPTIIFQRQFLPYVRSLLPSGTLLLLVFDEFEAFENLVDDGILPATFFTFMRHLMQHSDGLSFVFVGTRRLEQMSSDYWSVLFNIALYERIRYLSRDSAIQLIMEPVAPNLLYDDLALDKIWRVTAGHPYFLQLVCYTLVKRANIEKTGYITISDVNNGLDEMLSLGEVHFAYLWQRSTFAEKALLTAVAHMTDRDGTFYPEDLVGYLEPFNIYLSPADVTAALSSLVERDILREITFGATSQYDLQVGLVGLWVAKHKSLSKLQAESVTEEEPLPSLGGSAIRDRGTVKGNTSDSRTPSGRAAASSVSDP